MRVLTFQSGDGTARLGVMADHGQDRAWDLSTAWPGLPVPHSVDALIALGDAGLHVLRERVAELASTPGSRTVDLTKVQVLPPISGLRKNIFCVGRNYREHIIEGNIANGRDPHAFPKAIELFTKPPTAVIGHRCGIRRHAGLTAQLDYEVELGIVIGRRGADISRADALDHVFGYTVVNDITARDLQARHGQWFKGKALDTSCPIGPCVALAEAIPDPQSLALELDVNGELRQQACTSSMLFSVADIVAELSAGMTLEPGDIIATGTPSGVGFAMNPRRLLQVGDVVRARVQGIGELCNTIID